MPEQTETEFEEFKRLTARVISVPRSEIQKSTGCARAIRKGSFAGGDREANRIPIAFEIFRELGLAVSVGH